MKNIISSAFTGLTIMLVTLIGCKKEAKTSPAQSYTYDMTATINGVPFKESNCTFLEEMSFFYLNADSVSRQFYPRIQFGFINAFDTGWYNFPSAGAHVEIDSSAQNSIEAAYGHLHVDTRSSEMITGTFSFTCTDSTKVTNGSFTAKKY